MTRTFGAKLCAVKFRTVTKFCLKMRKIYRVYIYTIEKTINPKIHRIPQIFQNEYVPNQQHYIALFNKKIAHCKQVRPLDILFVKSQRHKGLCGVCFCLHPL